ncbi:MAG: hypothetical protein GF405_03860 [Candidatus Eisenbacteria bacterium]|nr:hypothetical protein [Candidatus Eisenbacteria bacterium]
MTHAAFTVRTPLRRGAVLLAVLLTSFLSPSLCEPSRAAPPGILALEPVGVVEPLSPERMVSPSSVAVDHRGRILIADAGRHVVGLYERHGAFVSEFGGFGWEDGRLDGPTDLAVVEGFSVSVLDEGNRRVVGFDESGNFVGVEVGEGVAGTPVGIALGPAGELYLVDTDSQTVLVRSQFDEALEPFGRFGTGQGGLVDPVAAAVAPDRSLAVADRGRRAVLLFDQFGAELGVATAPDSLDPVDVLFDPYGNLLVADRRHRRVLAFDPPGSSITSVLELDELAPGFEPVSIARGGDGEVVVLDGGEGDVAIIRPVHVRRSGTR